MGKEAEHAETVVDGNEDYAFFRPGLGVKLRLGAPAFAIAASVNPESDREFCVGNTGLRGPDIQI